MNRRIFPGAQYGDSRPDGSHVVMWPGPEKDKPETSGRVARIELNDSPVPLPAGEGFGPQFLAMGSNGRFAGLAHDLGHVYEWNGAWLDRGYFSAGRCAYLGNDLLGMEPAGIGYVDDNGQPVSRLITYETKNGLNSWSETAGLQIGQGHEQGGVLVYDGAGHRVLDMGPCNEIRVHRDGELVAVTYRKDGEGVWIVQAALSELRALPILGANVPNPGTPEPPKPEPTPMPVVPNESAFVAAFLAPRLKNMGSEEATRTHTFEAVNACCVALRSKGDLNWGLLEKTSGANVHGRAADILLYALGPDQAQVIDCVVASDGDPSPGWGLADIRPISQWRQPYPIAPEEPPVEPPAQDPSGILKSIEELRALVEADANLQAERYHELVSRIGDAEDHINALAQRIEVLANKPAPEYRVVGQTSRTWGHAHDLNVRLEPK